MGEFTRSVEKLAGITLACRKLESIHADMERLCAPAELAAVARKITALRRAILDPITDEGVPTVSFPSEGADRATSNKWRAVNDVPNPPDDPYDEDEVRCIVVWQDAENPTDLGVEATNLKCIRFGDFSRARYSNAHWISVMDAPAVGPWEEALRNEE